MALTKLSEKEIAAGLQNLAGWSVANGNLHRVFEFKDFSAAFGFMTRVALAAKKWTTIRTGPTPGTKSRWICARTALAV